MMPTNDAGPIPLGGYSSLMVRVGETLAEQVERQAVEIAQLRAEVLSLQMAMRRLDSERPAM